VPIYSCSYHRYHCWWQMPSWLDGFHYLNDGCLVPVSHSNCTVCVFTRCEGFIVWGGLMMEGLSGVQTG